MRKRICLNKSVLDFMEGRLGEGSVVIEFGSGWSSAWFAARCGHLITIETDLTWAERIETDLCHSGYLNWNMVWATSRKEVFTRKVKAVLIPADLILIDCCEKFRDLATKLAWDSLLKPGGTILFDDAQRPRHRKTISWLEQKAGAPTKLVWAPGDIESATERLTLAWRK